MQKRLTRNTITLDEASTRNQNKTSAQLTNPDKSEVENQNGACAGRQTQRDAQRGSNALAKELFLFLFFYVSASGVSRNKPTPHG